MVATGCFEFRSGRANPRLRTVADLAGTRAPTSGLILSVSPRDVLASLPADPFPFVLRHRSRFAGVQRRVQVFVDELADKTLLLGTQELANEFARRAAATRHDLSRHPLPVA